MRLLRGVEHWERERIASLRDNVDCRETLPLEADLHLRIWPQTFFGRGAEHVEEARGSLEEKVLRCRLPLALHEKEESVEEVRALEA